MKKILTFGILMLPLLAMGQISCPAFGRVQNYEKWEVLPTWNTVDPYSELGDFHFIETNYLTSGVTTNISSAPGLIIKYYPDDITAIRLKTIYTIRDIHDRREYFDSSISHIHITDDQFDQKLFKIAPGFQWTYFMQRFSFFGGFELPFTYQSDFTQNEFEIDSSVVDTFASITRTTSTVPGGFSIGIGFFAGSTFYYKKVLGIGFEISDAYEYSKLGGVAEYRSVTTSGNSVASAARDYVAEIHSWKFSPFQASIQLSLRF